MYCISCGRKAVDNSQYCSECMPVPQPFTSNRDKGEGLSSFFYLISLSAGLSIVILAFAGITALEVSVAYAEETALYTFLSFTILLTSIYMVVVKLVFIYKMWALIQDGYARTTPGKAVGFLFIPLFNLYWVFQAVWGFSRDYNSYISRHSINSTRLPERLFLAYAIINTTLIIPGVGWVLVLLVNPLLFIVMAFKTCEAVSIASAGTVPADQHAVTAPRRPFAFLTWPRVKNFKRRPLYAIVGVSVILAAVAVAFLIPRPRLSVEALTVPEQVVAGDDFIVAVTVENRGRADGTRTLALTINEEEYSTKEISVNAGSEETVQFEIEGILPAGANQVGLEGLAGEVRILKPAQFELSNFSLGPNPLRSGEETELAAELSNLGEVEGSYTISLTIEGEVEQTKEITLPGESSTRVFFPIIKNKPGNYTVALNGFSETLEVWQIERPANGTVFTNELKAGHGHLRIYNGDEQDAVVVLASPVNPQKALLQVYVRSKSRHTVTGIKNGTYLIYFSTGEDWDSYSRRFTKNSYHQKFEEEALYTEVYPRYNIISIEFSIAEGTARTERIPEYQFPN